MKKIRITLICSGEQEFPGCNELLAGCPEFRIVSHLDSLAAGGAWYAFTHSDLVMLDEAAVTSTGGTALRQVHEQFPFLKLLLVLDKSSRNKTMEALSMGVSGVIERADLVASIRKAIPLLVGGETWVSRNMVRSLHAQLKYAGDESLFAGKTRAGHYGHKLN